MKHIFFKALLLLFIYGLCACSDRQDNTAILQQIDEGLVQSNRQIRLTSSDILEAIEQKTYEQRTAERAKEIFPEAKAVQKETDGLFNYIESFKTSLPQNNSSGITLKNIEELHTKLTEYKRKILSLDGRLSEALSGKIFIVSEKVDSSNKVLNTLKEFLLVKQGLDAKAYLRRIENNLAVDELMAMKFLYYRATPTRDGYTVFEAIVGQNAQVLEAEKTLEITAGMGSFKTYPTAHIAVDGHPVPLNEKGYVVYQTKTPKKPGSYSIPVQVKFTDPDGKEQTRTITVQYKTVSAHLK